MTDILHRNWLKSAKINTSTGELLKHFHEKQKPTALICHAPAALAAAPEIDGQWLYHGYRMTCITMFSEYLVEEMPGFKVIPGHMPDYPEKILRRKGAVLKQQSIPMLPHVIEDRELLTGQDPYAANLLGERFSEKVNRHLLQIS